MDKPNYEIDQTQYKYKSGFKLSRMPLALKRSMIMMCHYAIANISKYIALEYWVENHAPNKELREYFDKENQEFSKIAKILLEIPFSWKALLFHSDDGFYINTYRENAFKKYCLMLDWIIPFKNRYEATELYIAPQLIETKKKLEASLSTDLEISKEQDPDLIFTHGHFIETLVEEESPDKYPF